MTDTDSSGRRLSGRGDVPRPPSTTMPLSRALNAGLRASLAGSDRVLLMGEDIGPLGGVFRVTEGLQAEFGDRRVLDTPARRVGHRRHRDRAGDGRASGRCARSSSTDSSSPRSTRSPRSSRRSRTGTRARCSMPVVIRIPYGGHIGAVEHHQESPEAYFTHTPGLRVVSPSTPNDALLDDPGRDRLGRPGDLPRAEEPSTGRRARSTRRARALPLHAVAHRPPRHRRHARRPRRDGDDAAAGRRARRVRGHQLRGRRPALAVARRLRADPRLGAAHRPHGLRAGGAGLHERSAPRSPRP